MRLTTSSLIHFSPDAGTPSEPVTPEPRLSLNLATRLDGVTDWNSYPGLGLSTTLTVHFAPPDAVSLCDRLRLTGISPMGHAPLVLDSVSYYGSTICYAGVESEPLLLYIDEPDDPPTLAIGFPTTNLWPFFEWPEGVWEFDPPIEPGESSAVFHQLELDSLDGINPDAEPRGVRLPMRLIATQVGATGEIEIDTLNYLDAPAFSGNHQHVSVSLPDSVPKRPSGAMWGITAAQLAEHFDVETEPVTLALYWRIYKGSGDMVYRGRCRNGTLDDTYRDRYNSGIGGGNGIFETTNLHVATIQLDRRPYEFLVNGEINFNAAGETRTIQADGAWGRPWVSADGAVLNLIQSIGCGYGDAPSPYIGMGGRVLCTAPSGVVCACLTEEPDTDALADNPDQTPPNRPVVRALCANGRFYHIRLGSNQAREVGQISGWPSLDYPSRTLKDPTASSPQWQPGKTIEPDLSTGCFSQDGLKVLIHAPASIEGGVYPGVVWELTLSVGTTGDGAATVTAGAWATLHQDHGDAEGAGHYPNPDVWNEDEHFGYNTLESTECAAKKDEDEGWRHNWEFSFERLLGAGYRGNTRVIRVAKLEEIGGWSMHFTEHTQINCCPFSITTTYSWYYSDEQKFLLTIKELGGSEEIKLKLHDQKYIEEGDGGQDYSNDEYTNENWEESYDPGQIDCYISYRDWDDSLMEWNQEYHDSKTSNNTITMNYLSRAVRIPSNTIDAPLVCFGEHTYTREYHQGGTNSRDMQYLSEIAFYGQGEENKLLSQPRGGTKWVFFSGEFPDWKTMPATYPESFGWASTKGSAWLLAVTLDELCNHKNVPLKQLWAATNSNGTTLAIAAIDADSMGALLPSGDSVSIDTTLTRATILSPRPVCRPGSELQPPADWSPPNPTAETLIAALNLYRGRFGLSSVTVDDALNAAIEDHVLWMRDHNALNHTGADDSTPTDRARAEGFTGAVGELIANNAVSHDEVIPGWHVTDASTIQDPRWNRIGVAIFTMGAAIDEQFWWGVLLGEGEST